MATTKLLKTDSATTRAAERIGWLILYLRQAPRKEIPLEHKNTLRKFFPQLPDESELEQVTQEELANKLIDLLPGEELSYASIQRWEGGASMPTPINLLRIAKYVGTDISKLYEYLFQEINTEIEVQPQEEISKLLLQVRSASMNVEDAARIIQAAAETMLEHVSNPSKSKGVEKMIDLSEGQKQKLAKILRKSLEQRSAEIPGDIAKCVLEADPNFRHSEKTFEIVASACCWVRAWDTEVDEPWLDCSRSYADNTEKLLKTLNGNGVTQHF